MRNNTPVTQSEYLLNEESTLMSTTNTQSHITYANSAFIEASGYKEEHLLGEPHNLIRHPDMPRCVFKFLWDRISAGHEVFAYVVNLAKTGDHYWVLAHVTPTRDATGKIIAYHSNRRVPDAAAVAAIEPIYRELRQVEAQAADRKQGMNLAYEALTEKLRSIGKSYDEFVLSL